MVNESEMRGIFRELNLQNQANLTFNARQFHIIHKEKKNEKACFNDRNTDLYAGIRDRDGTRPNGDS
jgi:hypothetical protein